MFSSIDKHRKLPRTFFLIIRTFQRMNIISSVSQSRVFLLLMWMLEDFIAKCRLVVSFSRQHLLFFVTFPSSGSSFGVDPQLCCVVWPLKAEEKYLRNVTMNWTRFRCRLHLATINALKMVECFDLGLSRWQILQLFVIVRRQVLRYWYYRDICEIYGIFLFSNKQMLL